MATRSDGSTPLTGGLRSVAIAATWRRTAEDCDAGEMVPASAA
jgi:hypothetical protein